MPGSSPQTPSLVLRHLFMIEIFLKPLPIKPNLITLTIYLMYFISEELIKPQMIVHSAPKRQIIIITPSLLWQGNWGNVFLGQQSGVFAKPPRWLQCSAVSHVGQKSSSAGYNGRISWFSLSGRCKCEKGRARPWKWCLWIFQFSAGHLNLKMPATFFSLALKREAISGVGQHALIWEI